MNRIARRFMSRLRPSPMHRPRRGAVAVVPLLALWSPAARPQTVGLASSNLPIIVIPAEEDRVLSPVYTDTSLMRNALGMAAAAAPGLLPR